MSDKKFKTPIQLATEQGGDIDEVTRIFYTLEIIGRARLRGGLHVVDLPLGLQQETEIELDRLAKFAKLIDINRAEHYERPE